jgi:hypothetical protein
VKFIVRELLSHYDNDPIYSLTRLSPFARVLFNLVFFISLAFENVSRLPRRQQEHIVRIVAALVMQYEQSRQ